MDMSCNEAKCLLTILWHLAIDNNYYFNVISSQAYNILSGELVMFQIFTFPRF